MRALATHEVGSMAKPPWRTKPFHNLSLTDADIEQARTWGERLAIDEHHELLELLARRAGFSRRERDRIVWFSSLYGTRLQERAGLDLVWDGEQHRVEMYEHPIRRIDGFAFRGHVRSFDNRYYRKASCINEPTLKDLYHLEEYETVSSLSNRPVKIPVTGAYTLVDWSFDEHYAQGVHPGQSDVGKARRAARRRFIDDIAVRVIHPNLRALCDGGARYLQLDEPAATTKRDELPELVRATRRSVGDLAGRAFIAMHICFSDYNLLFPHVRELEGIVDEIHLEYANRDTRELGRGAMKRIGYEILHQLRHTSFHVGLGVLDVHSNFIESPELVRDRILYACDLLADPRRISVAPDCGLRTRTWDVSFAKLRNMVEGREMAAKELAE